MDKIRNKLLSLRARVIHKKSTWYIAGFADALIVITVITALVKIVKG